MHEHIVKMQIWCNAWTFRIINTKPIPKISQNLHQFWKTPKIFKKTQNLDLNAWNAWRMRDREIIPNDLRQENAKNHMGRRFWERRGCLGGEETNSVERDQGEMKRKSRRSFIYKNHKAWQMEMCQEVLRFKMCEKAVEELSRICREVSNCCRDCLKTVFSEKKNTNMNAIKHVI